MSPALRILVTGGGTGGHTLPALATVEAIKKCLAAARAPEPIFLYVGSRAGLEARLAADSGIEFTSIATGKLRRAVNPLRMLSLTNIRDAFLVPLGFFQAVRVVSEFRPDVVFSTGGYVSVPAVLAAGLLRRPVLMHEQTVQIGLANRWSAKIASRIALSFAESADELSEPVRHKSFLTGPIVREIVTKGDAKNGRQRFGFDGDLAQFPVVYVTGGAQGSSLINQAVLDRLAELAEKCCIIHQCGRQRGANEQDEDRLKRAASRLPQSLRHRYAVTPFIGDEIGDVYAISDIVVGRSGAGTVSEVCAVGRPAIFVPLVPTGGDEQTRNAQRLVSLGAAQVIKQSEMSGEILLDRVAGLLADPKLRQSMSDAALTQARPDAAKVLAEAVIELGTAYDN